MSTSILKVRDAIQTVLLCRPSEEHIRDATRVLVEACQILDDELSEFKKDVDSGVRATIDRLESSLAHEIDLRKEHQRHTCNSYNKITELERRLGAVEMRREYLEKKLAEVTEERNDYAKWLKDATSDTEEIKTWRSVHHENTINVLRDLAKRAEEGAAKFVPGSGSQDPKACAVDIHQLSASYSAAADVLETLLK